MRIDLIGHAALLVRTGELSLLTDPWWAGPAYMDQWFPYPFPTPERHDLRALDALFLSHGHEDHTHEATLRTLRPDVRVVLPGQPEPGTPSWLRSLGFSRIDEIPSGSTLEIARGRSRMRLGVLTYLGDSILTIEADGEVLVNANDALHCARRDVIEAYCRLLRGRFRRIDYLFCGFGSASYFPNCLRIPGKDDIAVARRREVSFFENFALVARLLEPRFAVPFAAHFVLPATENWWISATRLALRPGATLARMLVGTPTDCVDLQPGDAIEDGRVENASAPPLPLTAIREEVLRRWPPAPEPPVVDELRFVRLVDRLRRTVRQQSACMTAHGPFDAAIELRDVPGAAIAIRVGRDAVEVAPVARDDAYAREADVVLETRTNILEAATTNEYGRDLICIGYGAIVRLRSAEVARRHLHEHLISGLTRFPSWRDRLRRAPLRCVRFLARDPGVRVAAARRLVASRTTKSPLYAIEHWM